MKAREQSLLQETAALAAELVAKDNALGAKDAENAALAAALAAKDNSLAAKDAEIARLRAMPAAAGGGGD